MKSICVNTFFTPSYAPLAAIVIPNLIKYCNKHGYKYLINETSDDKFHFVKIKDTRKLLDVFDVTFTIELDAMIMNHKIKIESFLDEENEMYYTTDRNGANFGVSLWKSTPYTKELLDKLISLENEFGDEQNYFEQNPIIDKVKVLQHPNFNSIPYPFYKPSLGVIGYKDGDEVTMPTMEQGNYETGNFVCHLPGKTLNERLTIFNELKQHIIYE